MPHRIVLIFSVMTFLLAFHAAGGVSKMSENQSERTICKETAIDNLFGSFYAITIAMEDPASPGSNLVPQKIERFGIPFFSYSKSIVTKDATRTIKLGFKVRHLILLGMNLADDVPLWIGDKLGAICLRYADGTIDNYPLVLGESIWWGSSFAECPEPFASDTKAATILAKTLRTYPRKPVSDGAYLAVIKPRDERIAAIEFHALDQVPGIFGLTVDPIDSEAALIGTRLPNGDISLETAAFLNGKPLLPEGVDEASRKRNLQALFDLMYTTESNLPSTFPVDTPAGYEGPFISFAGDKYAQILSNVFSHNLVDMAGKVDDEGTFHTSTKNAENYNYYNGCYMKDCGMYYTHSYARDLGRALGELVALGYIKKAKACADFCFRRARVWEQDETLKIQGQSLPRHMSCQLRLPSVTPGDDNGCFENDGHGMVTLFIYNLWRHLPDRDEWLRSRWEDVAGLGDWVVWQLEHPEITKYASASSSPATARILRQLQNGEITNATDRLWSDSEASGEPGHSLYCDAACIEGLMGLVDMAKSIGKNDTAEKWRATAERLRKGWEREGLEQHPKFGAVWEVPVTEGGFWVQNGILGPIMMSADRAGFSPDVDSLGWRKYNEATYNHATSDGGYFSLGVMGYGEGFITQCALLLDKMYDAEKWLRHVAQACYHADIKPYIVPEIIRTDATGTIMQRAGDLGNGIQQAEIMKALRIVVGIDDSHPSQLKLLPRMPYGWTNISVDRFPVLVERNSCRETAILKYSLQRKDAEMQLDVSSDKLLCAVRVRLGAFKSVPKNPIVLLDNKAVHATTTQSGDSWWIIFDVPEGKTTFTAKVQAGT